MHGSGICTFFSIVYISGAGEALMVVAVSVPRAGVEKVECISEHLLESWVILTALL
jgi:hypothetical protein